MAGPTTLARSFVALAVIAALGAVIGALSIDDRAKGATVGAVIAFVAVTTVASIVGGARDGWDRARFIGRYARPVGGACGAALFLVASALQDEEWSLDDIVWVVIVLVIGYSVGGILHAALERARWRGAAIGAALGATAQIAQASRGEGGGLVMALASTAFVAALGAGFELWRYEGYDVDSETNEV